MQLYAVRYMSKASRWIPPAVKMRTGQEGCASAADTHFILTSDSASMFQSDDAKGMCTNFWSLFLVCCMIGNLLDAWFCQ